MMTKPDIAIVDYGVGNLYSVTKAFDRFTSKCVVTEDPEVVSSASALVIPGVGAFGAGIQGLEARNLKGSIQAFAKSGKPVLGICLGAQLLLSEGHEFGRHAGLDIIKGVALRFPDQGKDVKIPHIGWSGIHKPRPDTWDNTILKSVEEGEMVYFVHSYILKPQDKEAVYITSTYGDFTFCSGVRKGNVYGFQFHPEKSGEEGLAIIKKFTELVS